MEVSYTTTLDDYVAFNRRMYRKSKVSRQLYLLNWLALPLLCLAGVPPLAATDGMGIVAVCLIVFGLLYAALFPAIHLLWFDACVRSYAKNLGVRGVVGPIRLILSDESMVEDTGVGRTEVKWRDMAGIDEIGDYTFILITGLSAAIVPRHGFDNEDDYLKVRDFARARIKSHTDSEQNAEGRSR